MEAKITPIAYIRNDFKEKFGVPRQSGRVETLSQIVFEPEFRDENALLGIEQFSHLWLIFDFSLSHRQKWSPTVRPPRLGGNKRVGVFASRSPFRPNNLGLSVVKLLSLEKTADKGIVLHVSGADIVDNTPIYDIKPYIPYADSIESAKGGYAEQNKGHKLEVVSQKLICNMITTSIMIGLGRVRGNKMVNMQLSNQKLVDRGTRMLVEELGLPYDEAKQLLLIHGEVQRAVNAYREAKK